MQKPKAIAVVGPTASGKTSLAIELAKHYNGEVISADSRQVYRGMDIGTAKVTEDEMDGVPHHLLDVADPDEVYTASSFVREAGAAMDCVHGRARLPIIAGGTFFYVDLLRGRMTAAPVEPDPTFRDSLEPYSTKELFELLEQQDARRASTIDPHNRRRLVRALEIIHTLGSVPEPTTAESPYDWLVLGISIDQETLKERFQDRLGAWLETGLVAEVTQLRTRVSPARFLEFGFEYTLTADYIDQKIDLNEFQQRFIEKNWQYAKRQLTWLKKDPEIVWIDPTDTAAIQDLLDSFLHS